MWDSSGGLGWSWVFVWLCLFCPSCYILPVFLPHNTNIRACRACRVCIVYYIIAVIGGVPILRAYYYAANSRFLYIIFFVIFFIFHFFVSCFPPDMAVSPSFYPLFCPTIARMSFCVQLVTRGNLKRLERKYEGFVYCVRIWYLFCAYLMVKC